MLDKIAGASQGGFPIVNGDVLAAAPDGSGGWYIGGRFTKVGGMNRNRLARVLPNGTVDPAWDPDLNEAVHDMMIVGSEVLVAGEFTSVDGIPKGRIAAIHGSTGVASSWNPHANGPVFTLARAGSKIVAGGEFTFMRTSPRQRLAMIDLSSNEPTPWNPQCNGAVHTIVELDSSLIVGGDFTMIGGLGRSYIASIDKDTGIPTVWNPGANARVESLVLAGPLLYAGGSFTEIGGASRSCIAALELENGSASAWNPGADLSVRSIAVSGGRVFIAGDFKSVGGSPRRHLASFEVPAEVPSAWNPNASAPARTLTPVENGIFVGGSFTMLGGRSRASLAAMDAATGVLLDWAPSTDGQVWELMASGTEVYIGGQFANVGGQPRANLAAVDATTGALLAWSPNPDSTVGKLAIHGSRLYVGGSFLSIDGQPRSRAASFDLPAWTLSEWNPIFAGPFSPSVVDFAFDGSSVFAAGDFHQVGGNSRLRVVELDATTALPTSWRPTPDGSVYCIHVMPDKVILGGDFFRSNSHFSHLAAVDKVVGDRINWPSSGASGIVMDFADMGSTLYAGGLFSRIGSYQRRGIAAIDLETGIPLSWDPAADREVYELQTTDSSLLVVGGFASMSGSPRRGFAQFDPAGVPLNPSNANAIEITSSSLKWTWADNSSDEDEFRLYVDSAFAGAPTTLRATLGPGSTEFSMGGLGPNSPHAFSIYAVNSLGASDEAAHAQGWTLANPPLAPEVGTPTPSSLEVRLHAGDGNPAYTDYAIICTTTGAWLQHDGTQTSTPLWRTATQWGTTTATGLDSGRVYRFVARARNGAGVETSDSQPGSAATTSLSSASRWWLYQE